MGDYRISFTVDVPVRYLGQVSQTDKDWIRTQIEGDRIPEYLIDQGWTWLSTVEVVNVVESVITQ